MVKLPQERNCLHLSLPFVGLIFSFGGRLNTSMLIFKCKKKIIKNASKKKPTCSSKNDLRFKVC